MQKVTVRKFKVKYPFRDLTNYKEMHRQRAIEKGVLAEFLAASNLTRARRVLFG